MSEQQLTANYRLSEFESASHRALTRQEVEKAGRFARELLQPARTAMGWPVFITSYVRTRNIGSGVHANGDAVDIQPCKTCGQTKLTTAEFSRRLEQLFVFLATHLPRGFGCVIHERTHIHITLPGVQGRTGVVMREPREGEYELASIGPIAALPLLPILLAGILWLLRKG